jgi:hypothetical protein
VFRRVAHDLGAVAVGEDEAALLGKDRGRHIRMRGEEEAVGMQPVFRPLAVDAEILDRRLDLDDPDISRPRQRDEVGAPAGSQAEFGQHMRAHLREQALDAAPDHHRPFGLAAVDERIGENRADDRHGPTMPRPGAGMNPFCSKLGGRAGCASRHAITFA